MQLSLEVAVAIAGIFIAVNLLPIARGYLLASVRSDTQTSLLENLLHNTYGMKLDEHISSPTGKFPQLLTAVYANVEKVVPTLHGELMPVVLDLTAIFIGLFYIHPLIGVAALCLYVASASFNRVQSPTATGMPTAQRPFLTETAARASATRLTAKAAFTVEST